jgi:hypothetical protein
VRFEAQLPSECWHSDVTHWRLAGGTEAQIVNFIDGLDAAATRN